MASPGVTFLFIAFLLLALVQISASLSCYQCGKMDSGCNDPFDNKTAPNYAKPCPKGSTACIKVVDPMEYDVTDRTCADDEGCNVYKRCFSCTKDLCNASSSFAPSFILIGVTGLALSIVKS